MHHSFRPPLPDLKSQKYQNSPLFHSAALLRSSLNFNAPLSLRVTQNTQEDMFLFAFRPLSGMQNKDKLCVLCAFAVNYYDFRNSKKVKKAAEKNVGYKKMLKQIDKYWYIYLNLKRLI